MLIFVEENNISIYIYIYSNFRNLAINIKFSSWKLMFTCTLGKKAKTFTYSPPTCGKCLEMMRKIGGQTSGFSSCSTATNQICDLLVYVVNERAIYGFLHLWILSHKEPLQFEAKFMNLFLHSTGFCIKYLEISWNILKKILTVNASNIIQRIIQQFVTCSPPSLPRWWWPCSPLPRGPSHSWPKPLSRARPWDRN